MNSYKVFLRLEAMDALRSVKGIQRGRISQFIDSLSRDPTQIGDYSELDEAQRHIEVKIVGQFAITYWSDHAVREVKGMDIHRADRP